MKTLCDYKTEIIIEIISDNIPRNINDILVVGCGSGLEAAILAQRLKANVTGIDLEDNFDNEAKKITNLEVGDAMSLRFPDSCFDFVYSYHTLEHIENPVIALKEIKRILRHSGGYWIGTPNRRRLIGYIGSKEATIKQKINWNIADWKARMTGKFTNELGAHAGFSVPELDSLLKSVFRTSYNVSDEYYRKIYSNKKKLLSFLKKTKISNVAYPSIYFMGSA